jgi:hypothetical protein
MQTDTIYEYSPYADEYTLFGCFDRLQWECEDHGLQMTVVQSGADSCGRATRRSTPASMPGPRFGWPAPTAGRTAAGVP